jgi:hypothetical protein
VLLTVSTTLPIQQAIAFSISCGKAEKEIDLLQDGGKIKKRTSITTVREQYQPFATFQTHTLSHWSLLLNSILKGDSFCWDLLRLPVGERQPRRYPPLTED